MWCVCVVVESDADLLRVGGRELPADFRCEMMRAGISAQGRSAGASAHSENQISRLTNKAEHAKTGLCGRTCV
jgi:hypothetical protein